MTEYVEQMNSIVERVNFASDDYWGDPGRFKFRASVQSFANTVEVPSDDDRVVSTTFSLTVNAHLLPEIFNNQTTSQRSLTKRSVIFSSETTTGGISDTSTQSSQSKNLFTLHRKQRIVYLNDVDVNYLIETWNDEAFYEVVLLNKIFKISFSSEDNLLEYATWDIDKVNKKIYRGDEYITPISDNYDVMIKVSSSSAMLIEISYIEK
jgi:hypothetical protein